MGKTETHLACTACGAGHDVSAMKPGHRFQCDCGHHLTAPARGGPRPLAIAAIAVLLLVPVAILAFGGKGSNPDDGTKRSVKSTSAEAPEPKTPEPKTTEPAPDLVQLDYEMLLKKAAKGGEKARTALRAFCAKHERYHGEARKMYLAMLDEDPDTPEALAFLKLALVEDLPTPNTKQTALLQSKWYRSASKTLHREVKSEQRFLDIGLRYAYAPPFAIVKERADDEAKDRRDRLQCIELLEGLYPALRALLADAVELPEDPEIVIPLFWFTSDHAWKLYWDSKSPRFGERVSRNPHWCVYRVGKRADAFALQGKVSPMLREGAVSMVEAALNPKGMTPQWLTHGIAAYLSRVVVHDDPEGPYSYGTSDPKALAELAGAETRLKLSDIVERSDQQDEVARQLLEWLKKQGRDDVTINTVQIGMRYVPPDTAWSLVCYLLEDDRRPQFLEFVKRVTKGGTPDAAFKKAIGEDIAAIDAAWLKWMEKAGGG